MYNRVTRTHKTFRVLTKDSFPVFLTTGSFIKWLKVYFIVHPVNRQNTKSGLFGQEFVSNRLM